MRCNRCTTLITVGTLPLLDPRLVTKNVGERAIDIKDDFIVEEAVPYPRVTDRVVPPLSIKLAWSNTIVACLRRELPATVNTPAIRALRLTARGIIWIGIGVVANTITIRVCRL